VLADSVDTEAFLHGRALQRAVNAVMIVVKVLGESRVDRIECFVFFLGKKLLSDRAEETFMLSST
jgi:hypothetical protein